MLTPSLLSLPYADMIASQEVILIVEDNLVLRKALEEILAKTGYTVLTAANGKEALDCMGTLTPNLIVSDITMPVMNGYDFFDAVRTRPDWFSIPFIFLTAHGSTTDIINGKTLGVEDYLIKPIHGDELVAAVRSKLNRSTQLRIFQLQEAYESSLTMLANAIEIRDRYTRGHVERVRDYALMIAKMMRFDEHSQNILRFGAILHDIGKIHIRENLLLKEDALNHEEWEEIKQHPIVGANMIKGIPYLRQAVPIVLNHHEYWDGSGYPHHLTGEEIPILARIVVVADSFDAMTSYRVYQPIRSPEKALSEISKGAGIQYDPQVVTALEATWKEGLVTEILKKQLTLST